MSDGMLMTAQEIGERLAMSKSGVYRLARLGKIPAYRCGAQLSGRRFSLCEVLAALRLPVPEPAVSKSEPTPNL